MNKAANTYWIDTRLAAQRPAGRAVALHAQAAVDNATAAAAPREFARSSSFSIPPWVLFCMITLATFALCATVTMRTHAEMRTAERKLESTSSDVNRLRDVNESLRREMERLRTDPGIEAAARERLNMVRANEIVMPLD